jgi:hypothetical protein
MNITTRVPYYLLDVCPMCWPVDEKVMRPPATTLRPSLNHVMVGAGLPSAAHCSSARPPVFSVRLSGCVVKVGTTVKTSPRDLNISIFQYCVLLFTMTAPPLFSVWEVYFIFFVFYSIVDPFWADHFKYMQKYLLLSSSVSKYTEAKALKKEEHSKLWKVPSSGI